MNLKEFLQKEIKTAINGMISEDTQLDQAFNDAKPVEESVMSELDLLAREARDLKSFIKTVYKEFDNLPKSKDTLKWLEDTYLSVTTDEHIEEAAKRDYKKEYEKYGKSEKAKKYRAELNKYNRDKGTYGNGDGKDASHKGGKIVGFEDESKNRGRAEKSRLKKESVNEFNSSINKRRAGAELKQKLKGKRSDGMGKYTATIYGLDSNGKRVELKSLNDLNKYSKFEIDESVNEAKLKISGPAYDFWDEREVQKKLRGVKIKIVGDIGGVLTVSGNDGELQKVKDILGLEESVNEGFTKKDWDVKWKMPKDNLFNVTKTTNAVNNRYKAMQSLLKSKPKELKAFDADENHPAYDMTYDELMKWYNKLDESVNEGKKKLPKFKNIPSWARYVAQHSDGEWTWYEETPTMIKFRDGSGGAWKQDGNQTYTGVKTDGSDWDKNPTYYKVKNGKITESSEQIDEKLITFSNRAPYGQIVFMAGGAGSGKGFAKDNFIDAAGFRVRDVDEMKTAVAKLDQMGKFSVDKWYKKYGKKLSDKPDKSGGLSPKAHVEEFVLGKGLSIADIANPKHKLGGLKNPNNVASLHYIVDSMGLKDKWVVSMLSGKNNKETLPNLLFDITAKKVSSITDVIKPLMNAGYDSKNVHLIWVLANFHVAIKANKKRERVVPEDILLQTHEGAADTMWGVMTKILPKGLNGRIDVILNKYSETVPYVDSNGKPILVQPNQKNKLKAAQIVVKGFTSLPIKKQGGGVQPEKAWKEILKKWVLDNAPKTIDLSQKLEEANNDYFKTAGEAVEFAKKAAEKKGFDIDEDDWNSQITMGGKYNRLRPGVGKTHSFQIGLLKKGKPQRKGLAISLYGMDSGKYELTHYIN